ncbi:hypothetical protein [Leptospira stimsonii]|nr:hypothetical protein [Leptospira stimsonii]
MILLAQLTGLNLQGTLIMSLSLLLVTGLSLFCIYKLFRTRNH